MSLLLERRLRTLSVLDSVISFTGCSTSLSNTSSELVSILLWTPAAHAALLDVVAWVSGPVQTAFGRVCSPICDAAYARLSKPTWLLLSATLALLARLLAAAHGSHCPLHDAIAARGQTSGVTRLGMAILLHAELWGRGHDTDTLGWLPPWMCDKELSSLDKVIAIGPDPARFALASVGPLAARCLALMCRSLARQRPKVRLLPHLVPITAAISCTLSAWFTAATAPSNNSLAPKSVLLDANTTVDCASAGLQLLNACADMQLDLFRALCGGILMPGETVRLRVGCQRPAGGWGLVIPGAVGTIQALHQSFVFVDFGAHAWWRGSCSGVFLEPCAPLQGRRGEMTHIPAANDAAVTPTWETWAALKRTLDEALQEPLTEAARSTFPSPNCGGSGSPLIELLLLLLKTDRDPCHALGLSGLQVQALAVIATMWRDPTKHICTLETIRKQNRLWSCLGNLVQRDASSAARMAGCVCQPGFTELRGAATSALCLTILTHEVAFSASQTLLRHTALIIDETLRLDDVHQPHESKLGTNDRITARRNG